MTVNVFSAEVLDDLISRAKASPRYRQHLNIHKDYHDLSQRVFNAIEPNSYIQPHRHSLTQRTETMIGVRGRVALIAFDEGGEISRVVHLDTNISDSKSASAVEILPDTWHTVVALETGSVILKIKAGPFDPSQAGEYAAWAPSEDSPEAISYLEALHRRISTHKPE
jgi:cupin fold WbuC family metalloprotein